MKARIKKLIKDEYDFFCVCDSCGSLAWLDYTLRDLVTGIGGEPFRNALKDNGEMSVRQSKVFTFEDLFKENRRNTYDCFDCERPLKAIHFKDCDKRTRKKIASMTKGKRIVWAKNFMMLKELMVGTEKLTPIKTP